MQLHAALRAYDPSDPEHLGLARRGWTGPDGSGVYLTQDDHGNLAFVAVWNGRSATGAIPVGLGSDDIVAHDWNVCGIEGDRATRIGTIIPPGSTDQGWTRIR